MNLSDLYICLPPVTSLIDPSSGTVSMLSSSSTLVTSSALVTSSEDSLLHEKVIEGKLQGRVHITFLGYSYYSYSPHYSPLMKNATLLFLSRMITDITVLFTLQLELKADGSSRNYSMYVKVKSKK